MDKITGVTDNPIKMKREVIAIDGKWIRGSYDRFDQKAAIHVVSAWAQQNALVLGQVKSDDKSNEITAIPKIFINRE